MWRRVGDRGEPHYAGKEGVNNSSQACAMAGVDGQSWEGMAQHFLFPGGPMQPEEEVTILNNLVFLKLPMAPLIHHSAHPGLGGLG